MSVQSGVLLEGCSAAIYLEANIKNLADIPNACRQFNAQLEQFQQQYPDAKLGAVIAFGNLAWKRLGGIHSAPELKPFKALGRGEISAPASQYDLLIHIQSMRPDVNFSVAQAAIEIFGANVEVEQEVHGFRWVEERDLIGFIDGTENPKAEQRRLVGCISDGDDKDGSYVLTQRYQHNLTTWNKLTDKEQELVVGRTKVDSIELDEVPQNSHVGRVDLKEKGQGLKILRQSLPYGTASGVHGLYFIAYCHSLYNIEQQLLSMFGEKDGATDRILDFSRAVTGSYYFAPSLEKLLNL